jgi:hypothetical protein
VLAATRRRLGASLDTTRRGTTFRATPLGTGLVPAPVVTPTIRPRPLRTLPLPASFRARVLFTSLLAATFAARPFRALGVASRLRARLSARFTLIATTP